MTRLRAYRLPRHHRAPLSIFRGTIAAATGAAALLLGPAGLTAAQAQGTTSLDLVPSDAMRALGGYAPIRLTLSDSRPAQIKKAPVDLAAPRYGLLNFGNGAVIPVIVDEPAGKDARLFVDSNGNGDLTDDPTTEWKKAPYQGSNGANLVRYMGNAQVPLRDASGKATPVQIGLYRFDKADADRAALKDTLLYYRDYARKGKMTLAGKSYTVQLDDMRATGNFASPPGVFLLIDANGNGKFDARGERYPVEKPFNIAGTTYQISKIDPAGSTLTASTSAGSVAEILPPPDLSAGKPALTFSAQTTDGKTVQFPGDFKGKLVMVDFWATWCGPCRAELPHLTQAYKEFHGKGFEVLGISLDQEKMADKLAAFTKENDMPWAQVYDGKFWDGAVAQLYVVQAIPAAFLVDGDTGKIVASGDALRGEKLKETLTAALASKAGK